MNFRIANTFTASLAKLGANEQKATKTTVFDLQMDPSHPGLKFHRLNKAKDPNFWSVRVNSDIRVIVHKTADDILVCYVDHHDPAYAWGERRRLDRHPRTGAMQLVEVRERIEHIPVYQEVESMPEAPPEAPSPALRHTTHDDLLQYGVPEDWIDDILAANEDQLLELVRHLPAEAAEAVLDLAVGNTPQVTPTADDEKGFDHPDTKRRFQLVTDEEALRLALDYPWEQWTIFLHPSQQRFVDQSYNGPARITGSAGTGKTVVALHRAARITRNNPAARILLTTFSPALADLLRIKLERLLGKDSRALRQITVQSLPEVAADLHARFLGAYSEAGDDLIRELTAQVIKDTGSELTPAFVWSEWRMILDAWQVESLEQYQEVQRIGRRTRLGPRQREAVWQVCQVVRDRLDDLGKTTRATAFARLTDHLQQSTERPYDHAVVDEAQDLSVAELKFLAALGEGRPEALFFAGDSGQRIFQTPFSWRSLGVDIRGRSNRLRINYRTSQQIRARADRLLPGEVADADGNVEDRSGTISVFTGAQPVIHRFDDRDAEIEGVATLLHGLLAADMRPEELAVFVRSEAQLPRARAAFKRSGIGWTELERTSLPPAGQVALSTMHLAKGLEFRAVIVMACDHDVIPLDARVATVSDEYELEEVFNTERHLLYVAATRARELLHLTGVDPVSEFVEDMAH